MERVLVVDDEKSIRMTLREFLCDGGFDVDVAEDADKAIDLLERKSYDVVVSDIVLPRVNGVELLHCIRRVAPDVQVVMMTGEPTVETASEAVRCGAADYLFKPISKNAILRSVSHAARVKKLEDERRGLEVANLRYQQDLERLVDERTAALIDANRRLKLALDELQQAQEQMIRQERLRALGQMVSGIAHDFNNLLMPILGMAEFLLDDATVWHDEAETRGALETIRSAASDAREIIRRLREFYSPGEQVRMLPTDIGGVVGQAIALTEPVWRVQAEAEGRVFTIEQHIDGLPPVRGNPTHLNEMLTNLIINAVDAMPEGGVIRIGGSADGAHVVLEVADTGTGMPEDVRRRCLEPFFSTKGERGTGMGLAMCYGIVQRHNGKLDIDSVEGEGTTVRINLPVAMREDDEQRIECVVKDRPSASLRILVADDEPWVRKILSKCLKRDGHDCVLVNSGAECVEKLKQSDYDLLVTDRAMPGMSGDEVARVAKELRPGLPVIMLTGFGDIMTYTDDRPDGVELVLGKPVTPDELRGAVEGVMSRAGGRRAEPAAEGE